MLIPKVLATCWQNKVNYVELVSRYRTERPLIFITKLNTKGELLGGGEGWMSRRGVDQWQLTTRIYPTNKPFSSDTLFLLAVDIPALLVSLYVLRLEVINSKIVCSLLLSSYGFNFISYPKI